MGQFGGLLLAFVLLTAENIAEEIQTGQTICWRCENKLCNLEFIKGTACDESGQYRDLLRCLASCSGLRPVPVGSATAGMAVAQTSTPGHSSCWTCHNGGECNYTFSSGGGCVSQSSYRRAYQCYENCGTGKTHINEVSRSYGVKSLSYPGGLTCWTCESEVCVLKTTDVRSCGIGNTYDDVDDCLRECGSGPSYPGYKTLCWKCADFYDCRPFLVYDRSLCIGDYLYYSRRQCALDCRPGGGTEEISRYKRSNDYKRCWRCTDGGYCTHEERLRPNCRKRFLYSLRRDCENYCGYDGGGDYGGSGGGRRAMEECWKCVDSSFCVPIRREESGCRERFLYSTRSKCEAYCGGEVEDRCWKCEDNICIRESIKRESCREQYLYSTRDKCEKFCDGGGQDGCWKCTDRHECVEEHVDRESCRKRFLYSTRAKCKQYCGLNSRSSHKRSKSKSRSKGGSTSRSGDITHDSESDENEAVDTSRSAKLGDSHESESDENEAADVSRSATVPRDSEPDDSKSDEMEAKDTSRSATVPLDSESDEMEEMDTSRSATVPQDSGSEESEEIASSRTATVVRDCYHCKKGDCDRVADVPGGCAGEDGMYESLETCQGACRTYFIMYNSLKQSMAAKAPAGAARSGPRGLFARDSRIEETCYQCYGGRCLPAKVSAAKCVYRGYYNTTDECKKACGEVKMICFRCVAGRCKPIEETPSNCDKEGHFKWKEQCESRCGYGIECWKCDHHLERCVIIYVRDTACRGDLFGAGFQCNPKCGNGGRSALLGSDELEDPELDSSESLESARLAENYQD